MAVNLKPRREKLEWYCNTLCVYTLIMLNLVAPLCVTMNVYIRPVLPSN